MRAYVDSITIANTVRMSGGTRRGTPSILIASDADVQVVKAMMRTRPYRVIPAGNVENAIGALDILTQYGAAGTLAIVNATTEMGDERSVTEEMHTIRTLEGTWEEIAVYNRELAGRRVRVALLDEQPLHPVHTRTPNSMMLTAIDQVDNIQRNMGRETGRDAQDYLREARAGGMFGDVAPE